MVTIVTIIFHSLIYSIFGNLFIYPDLRAGSGFISVCSWGFFFQLFADIKRGSNNMTHSQTQWEDFKDWKQTSPAGAFVQYILNQYHYSVVCVYKTNIYDINLPYRNYFVIDCSLTQTTDNSMTCLPYEYKSLVISAIDWSQYVYLTDISMTSLP